MPEIHEILGRRKAFIPYIVAGDPDRPTTLATMKTLADHGADVIELGIPFTDPIADGPTIQRAAERALQNPFSMADIFQLVRDFRAAGYHETGLLLMTYANPVFAMGIENFVRQAAESGIDAALITDLPPEEAADYLSSARAAGLETVFLASPTTSAGRLKTIDVAATAFVYYVARAGVTGTREDLPEDLQQKLAELRAQLSNRLAVGFGISRPEHAVAIARHADAVVVGSALVKSFETHTGPDLQSAIAAFTTRIREALDDS